LKKWDYRLTAESEAGAIFQIWWSYFYRDVWAGRLRRVPNDFMPLQEQTLQLFEEPALSSKLPSLGIDAKAVVYKSFREAMDSISRMPAQAGSKAPVAPWYQVKNTSIRHLTKLPALSYDHLKVGGWGNTVNAAKGEHGPSWRMVVQMGGNIEAYGVYPGGQSGNPGSKYYGNFIQDWVQGKYYRLAFLPNAETQNDTVIKYTWTVKP
jgi:penicillin amidase